jgi:hypothetical protein
MLAAIMKWLDAMDEKLKGLDPIRDKVTSLEAATDELGNQQVTMMATVECVDIAHAALNARLNRVEGGTARRRRTVCCTMDEGARATTTSNPAAISFKRHTS